MADAPPQIPGGVVRVSGRAGLVKPRDVALEAGAPPAVDEIEIESGVVANHLATVGAYWSVEVVGKMRPSPKPLAPSMRLQRGKADSDGRAAKAEIQLLLSKNEEWHR